MKYENLNGVVQRFLLAQDNSLAWEHGFRTQLDATFHVDHLIQNAFAPFGHSKAVQVNQPGPSSCNNFCQLFQATLDCSLLVFPVKTLDLTYDALIDSGASHNFLSKKTFDALCKQQKACEFSKIMVGTQDTLNVTLANGTTTQSKLQASLNVQMENVQSLHVQCNIVSSLCVDLVLGMPFLKAANPSIDWNDYIVKFSDGSSIQAIPVKPGQSRVQIAEILAKTAVRLLRQQDSLGCFTLIRGDKNV